MTIPTPEAIAALARELRAHWNSPGPSIKSYSDDAAWILSRFVRREEHEADMQREKDTIDSYRREIHLCSADLYCARDEVAALMTQRARLRAELHAQRCDGSGYLRGVESQNVLMCPSCSACKPTPIQEANRQANKELWLPKPTPDRCDCGGLYVGGKCVRQCDESEPDATPKGDGCDLCSCAEIAYNRACNCFCHLPGGSGDQLPEPAAPVPVEHVVKLHPETLLALVAGIVAAGHASAPNPDHTADWAVDLTRTILAKLEATQP